METKYDGSLNLRSFLCFSGGLVSLDSFRTMKQLAIIRKIILENLEKDFVPFPINKKLCTKWADGLNLPEKGETVLYTSYMYQLAGIFKSYEALLPKIGALGGIQSLGSLGKLLVRPDRQDMERAGKILAQISWLLKDSGLDVCYLYENEPYSGALLLELGMIREFREYGNRLSKFFEARGISRIITVDPHTLNALTRLREMSVLKVELDSYLDVVDLRRRTTGLNKTYVLHDSCLYARYLGRRAVIREKLSQAGIELKEDDIVTGQGTSMCCGAPVGAVNRELSERIAQARSSALLKVSDSILVACPLCYQNLAAFADDVKDIMEVIV
jgi:Fe-S oxidoreductase